ncbi:helix-turn-helix transcriptional regulator [Hungatella sp. L12]|uniref:Helix-turn-helix transcriptional regulator n=1 Tax=Hungatella hominis TaxID=2763050 RepID=A0ABR7HCG3_9FIRM|nr:helix-turn-helix transcriptional regulator [Hungatella hominis]MBC5710837.1 helix-turn-helix transcriptional regulator [Hungatella hominis]
MEMYERIKELRKSELKLSQEEFGKKLGVSRSVINNIERNVLARPEQKEPLIKLICKEFDVNEEWLRDGTGTMYRQLSRDEAIIDWAASLLKEEEEDMSEEMQYAKAFAEMLSKLSVDDWKVLAKMAKLMENIKHS